MSTAARERRRQDHITRVDADLAAVNATFPGINHHVAVYAVCLFPDRARQRAYLDSFTGDMYAACPLSCCADR